MGEDEAGTARPTRMRARWTKRRPPWRKPAASSPISLWKWLVAHAPNLPRLFEGLRKAGMPEEWIKFEGSLRQAGVAVLVACRLAGLSALGAHYAGLNPLPQ